MDFAPVLSVPQCLRLLGVECFYDKGRNHYVIQGQALSRTYRFPETEFGSVGTYFESQLADWLPSTAFPTTPVSRGMKCSIPEMVECVGPVESFQQFMEVLNEKSTRSIFSNAGAITLLDAISGTHRDGYVEGVNEAAAKRLLMVFPDAFLVGERLYLRPSKEVLDLAVTEVQKICQVGITAPMQSKYSAATSVTNLSGPSTAGVKEPDVQLTNGEEPLKVFRFLVGHKTKLDRGQQSAESYSRNVFGVDKRIDIKPGWWRSFPAGKRSWEEIEEYNLDYLATHYPELSVQECRRVSAGMLATRNQNLLVHVAEDGSVTVQKQ